MRSIHEIANMPTLVKGNFRDGIHESIFRASGILDLVEYLLIKETDTKIILALIDQIENHPGVDRDVHGQRVVELTTTND